jgi:hypothetical protein
MNAPNLNNSPARARKKAESQCLPVKVLLKNGNFNDCPWRDHTSTQVKISCQKLGFFSSDETAEMLEFTELNVTCDNFDIINRCDLVRVSKRCPLENDVSNVGIPVVQPYQQKKDAFARLLI